MPHSLAESVATSVYFMLADVLVSQKKSSYTATGRTLSAARRVASDETKKGLVSFTLDVCERAPVFSKVEL